MPRDDRTHAPPADDADLAGEAVRQLRDHEDRREAAEMRIEELVREAEYEEHGPRGSRVRPAVWVAAALLALAGVALYALLRSG